MNILGSRDLSQDALLQKIAFWHIAELQIMYIMTYAGIPCAGSFTY
jgi:hypothetical protein